jgi:hypothetical protein
MKFKILKLLRESSDSPYIPSLETMSAGQHFNEESLRPDLGFYIYDATRSDRQAFLVLRGAIMREHEKMKGIADKAIQALMGVRVPPLELGVKLTGTYPQHYTQILRLENVQALDIAMDEGMVTDSGGTVWDCSYDELRKLWLNKGFIYYDKGRRLALYYHDSCFRLIQFFDERRPFEK